MPQNVSYSSVGPEEVCKPSDNYMHSVSPAYHHHHACPITHHDCRKHWNMAEETRRQIGSRRCPSGDRDRQSTNGLRISRGRCSSKDSEGVRRKGRSCRKCKV